MASIISNPSTPEATLQALVENVNELVAEGGGSGITSLTGGVTASGSGSVVATVVEIPPGVTLTGTPATGKVSTATSSSAATWQALPVASSSVFGVAKVNGTTITASAGVISAVGGGGGGLTQIDQVVVGSGGEATISFGSIPDTYTNLLLILNGQNSGSGGKNLLLQFNGDTAAHYDYVQIYTTNSVPAVGGSPATDQTSIPIGELNDSSTAFSSSVKVTIPSYASTAFNKTAVGEAFVAGIPTAVVSQGDWQSTAAINAILLSLASGDFVQGTVATLYGLQ